MEFTLAYFWIFKVIVGVLTGVSFYQTVKTKNKFWLIFSGILVLLNFYSPIKLDTGTQKYQQQTNYVIEQQKVLPKKEVDNTFEETQKKIQKITKEEIWK